MCFVSESPNKFTMEDHSIVCYKLIQRVSDGKYATPYMGTPVEIGETLVGKSHMWPIDTLNIELNRCRIKAYVASVKEFIIPSPIIPNMARNIQVKEGLNIGEGFIHAYRTFSTAKKHYYSGLFEGVALTEWIIPPNTPFSTNSDDEIIATRMRFKSILREWAI